MNTTVTIIIWIAVYILGGFVTMAVYSEGIEESRVRLKKEDYKVRIEGRLGPDKIDQSIALTYLIYFTFWWYFFIIRLIK